MRTTRASATPHFLCAANPPSQPSLIPPSISSTPRTTTQDRQRRLAGRHNVEQAQGVAHLRQLPQAQGEYLHAGGDGQLGTTATPRVLAAPSAVFRRASAAPTARGLPSPHSLTGQIKCVEDEDDKNLEGPCVGCRNLQIACTYNYVKKKPGRKNA